MREKRSGSQILFGYLPDQTVDLAGRVWRVDRWKDPEPVGVDADTLRTELVRTMARWTINKKDGDFAQDLREGARIEVVSLNFDTGVKVEPFPRIWLCRRCGRATREEGRACACGGRGRGQLHFVSFHDCGALEEPKLASCPVHHEVKIVFPGTASAADIRQECPVCAKLLQKGLGFRNCSCGTGLLQAQVHRAASVFTPRSIVMVNPMTPARVKSLREAGGPGRALSWVLDGMRTRDFTSVGVTREAFLASLLATGIPSALAEKMAAEAEASGALDRTATTLSPETPSEVREVAMHEAVTLSTALFESRYTLADLRDEAPESLRELYGAPYERAIEQAGLKAVEFIDRFPVLSAVYGYSRGDPTPGATRLVPFHGRDGMYRVYADLAETEALFFRLRPMQVHRWLDRRGLFVPEATDDRTARIAITRTTRLPNPGDEAPSDATVGSEVLRLVHSYAHRAMRLISVYAGIERTALSELLVPTHLGFFVFAAARGDFVLGGLQALYETELDRVLREIRRAEHRCALDPGCEKDGAACAVCLHVGEPSCRWFNSFLDRRALHGAHGYFQSR